VQPYDYTEGASIIDVNDVLASNRLARRDSQSSAFYGDDEGGAMFDGPGHAVNPSSVSRMSQKEGRKRSGEWLADSRRRSYESIASSRGRVSRRTSIDSQMSQQSIEGQADGDEDGGHGGLGRSRAERKSPSPVPAMASVLGNIAHLFGRTASTNEHRTRRHSLSQYSVTSSAGQSHRSRVSDVASDDGFETGAEEGWGYTSGEEDDSDTEIAKEDASAINSMEYDSEPPSPGPSFPLLSPDPIFGGEVRIDIEVPFEDLDPPPSGPPSRQTIYIADEDTTVRFVGYECLPVRQHLWRAGCILTLGILALLGHWFPRLWLRCVTREKAFIDMTHGFVVVEVGLTVYPYFCVVQMTRKTAHGSAALIPVRTIKYPYRISTVFGATVTETSFPERGPMTILQKLGETADGEMLDHLCIVDYRYSRFALDPRTGLFSMIRYLCPWILSQAL
jgi:cation-transporting ATPase 13A2